MGLFGAAQICRERGKNIVVILMSAKLATLDPLKKVFWNKIYDIIIFVYDVTNKILLRNSNYVVDVAMWPKFGNSIISMKENIMTSI